MRSGVDGTPWKPGPPARDTSARAVRRPQNLDACAMKKILVGTAAFGCMKGAIRGRQNGNSGLTGNCRVTALLEQREGVTT